MNVITNDKVTGIVNTSTVGQHHDNGRSNRVTNVCREKISNEETSKSKSENKKVTKLTPNDHLIIAVKGYKKNLAAFGIGLINPVIGLMVAACDVDESSSDLENIDRALSKGADINYQEEKSGYTALIYAAYYGYPSIGSYLIRKGADVNIKEKDGYNAYTMAMHYLKRYSRSLQINEERKAENESETKEKEEMRDYYTGYIQRYQQLVDLLEPSTTEKQLQNSSCSIM